MKTWLEPQPVIVPTDISDAVGGNKLLSEILVRRGITDPDRIQAFLDPDRHAPASPYDLQDMQAAVDRLSIALQERQRICVWGDFDVDGQTATTLLVSSLRKLGGVVKYHIPIRSKESHGINLPVLQEIIAGGIDLLLTCDTGIGAHEAVEYASSNGVDVIITDHHDLPPDLPEALAVINPKRGGRDHPMAGMPGVGVAYELARALFEKMDQPGGADDHLDLVALGIVADLAFHSSEVRYLLQRGLESLRQPRRLGLQMMMDVAEINPAGITEEQIGFELGPRLNALGRLDDANQAVEFLTTTDRSQARQIANHLEGLNAHRKVITKHVFEGAQAQIESDASLLQDAALVLDHHSWPGGVIGIVASQLVERYNKPALLITSPPGELARGSARSIPGVDISAAIAAQHEVLEGFGGHPMAAGFSLQADRIPEFRRGVSRTVIEMLGDTRYEPTLQIDADIPLEDITLELITELERMAPFGPGNPNLVLRNPNLLYKNVSKLGKSGDHLLVRLENSSGADHKAVWWGGGIEPLPEWMASGALLDLAYTARSRDYKGKQEVHIEWLEAQPAGGAPVEEVVQRGEIEVIDHRESPAPLMDLAQLSSDKENLVIWAEAQAKDNLSGKGIRSGHRFELEAADELVIWTLPPGWQELKSLIERVSPEVVHLFAVDPGMDQVKSFTERLVGLAKYALRKTKGEVSIASLAAATAQREEIVKAGLEWLETRGDLAVLYKTRGQVCLSEGDGMRGEKFESMDNRLREMLGEIARYRRRYSSADADLLIEQIIIR